MSNGIDNVANARRCIDGLHEYQSEEGMTDASMLTVAIEAQVHATLALVEQQRITNEDTRAGVEEMLAKVAEVSEIAKRGWAAYYAATEGGEEK